MITKSHHSVKRFIGLFSLIFPFLALFILISSFQTSQAAGEGNALEFDGVSDYVHFTEPLVNIIGPTWHLTKTVSVWVKPTAAAPQVSQSFLGELIVGDFPRWFGIYWANTDGQDKIWVFNSSTVNPTFTAIGIPHTVGEWAYITLWHEAGLLRAYKNGVLIGSGATQPTALNHPGLNNIKLRIGGHIQGSNWETLFTGEIDEVRLWDTALTPAQIRENMYRPLAGNEANLAAYYNMSSSSGITLTDQTGNGWDGLLVDGVPGSIRPPDGDTAVWITSTAFVGPRNTLFFDGNNDYVALGSDAQTLVGNGWASSKTVDVWLATISSSPTTANAAAGKAIVGGTNWGISQATIANQDFIWVWNNDGTEDRIAIPYTPALWMHVALVHDGGMLTAYKNGELVGSIATGSTAADGAVTIAGIPGGPYFGGALDELRFWDYGRNQIEIQAPESISQTLAYNQSGLSAYYRFDQYNDSDQTTLYDTTLNNHHGTLVNMDGSSAWIASGAFDSQATLPTQPPGSAINIYLPAILK